MEIFTKQSPAVFKIIISDKTWLESDAIAQLENTARLEGMERAVGLPDLHPGKGHPIGAAFLTKGWIYPQLVGSDIGCGMGFWQTDLKTNKIKLDKWAEKLDRLDAPWDGDCKAWLEARNVDSTDFDVSLGTIGGGNHFAELQKAETVYYLEHYGSHCTSTNNRSSCWFIPDRAGWEKISCACIPTNIMTKAFRMQPKKQPHTLKNMTTLYSGHRQMVP